MTKTILNIIKQNINLCLIVSIFCASRIIYYFYFGIRFDATPLPYFWQYIDPELLKHNLLQSLYYLHSLPPLFNFFLGVVLKLFPSNYPVAFHFIYMFFGLVFSISLYLVMKEMGIKPKLSLLLTSVFIISPLVVEYENWLFYEYPTAVILIMCALFLHRFAVFKKSSDCFIFFLLAALIVYIRGLLSLHWFLLVMIILLAFERRVWKMIVLCWLLPAILIFALYFKNFIVFNSFSASDAQVGQSLALTVTGILPDQYLKFLIDHKKITSVYNTPSYSMDFSQYALYGINVKQTGVPILDQRLKPSGYPNTNNLIYLEVGKLKLKDAIYVLKHYPTFILKERWSFIIKNYFLPSDQCSPFYGGFRSDQWNRWDNFFKRFILLKRSDSQYLSLKFGLPILLIYGLFLILQSFKLYLSSNRLLLLFMVMTILFLFILTMFIPTDTSRYRFLVDSFYLILFGLLINDLMKWLKFFLRSY